MKQKRETKDEGGFMDQWFRDAIDRKYSKELKDWDKKEKEFDRNPNNLGKKRGV